VGCKHVWVCEPFCGNGSCDDGEDCQGCPTDCGECDASCCTPQATPGCEDPGVMDCVCSQASWCCEQVWDETCVMLVDELGCGVCGGTVCGDGTCDAGEVCGECFADCGECADLCGDQQCNGEETCATCASDCGTCGESCCEA